MPNITSVGLTAGVPTSGTGTVSTLDNVIGTAGAPSTNILTVQGVAGGVPLNPDSGVLYSFTSAVASSTLTLTGTQGVQFNLTGTWAGVVNAQISTDQITWTTVPLLQISLTTPTFIPGNTGATANGVYLLVGSQGARYAHVLVTTYTSGTIAGSISASSQGSSVTYGDYVNWLAQTGGNGLNTPAVKAASTAPLATDPAFVVSISPNSINANGRNIPGNSAPVVLSSMVYKTVAASSTATLLGTTGASGDYLESILVIPATTAAGAVSITDGAGSAIPIYTGGGTTALTILNPVYIPIKAISSGGAGGWKVTTGTNVSVIGVGNFT